MTRVTLLCHFCNSDRPPASHTCVVCPTDTHRALKRAGLLLGRPQLAAAIPLCNIGKAGAPRHDRKSSTPHHPQPPWRFRCISSASLTAPEPIPAPARHSEHAIAPHMRAAHEPFIDHRLTKSPQPGLGWVWGWEERLPRPSPRMVRRVGLTECGWGGKGSRGPAAWPAERAAIACALQVDLRVP